MLFKWLRCCKQFGGKASSVIEAYKGRYNGMLLVTVTVFRQPTALYSSGMKHALLNKLSGEWGDSDGHLINHAD